MKPLSQATEQEKLDALKELAGVCKENIIWRPDKSYDAIIPLIQKLWEQNKLDVALFYKALPGYHPTVLYFLDKITPSQLCDALLVSAGKFSL